MRSILILALALSLSACGGSVAQREGYPRLSEVPDRPQTTLTPERTAEINHELQEARDEAVEHAQEGRRSDHVSAAQDDVTPEPEDTTQEEETPAE